MAEDEKEYNHVDLEVDKIYKKISELEKKVDDLEMKYDQGHGQRIEKLEVIYEQNVDRIIAYSNMEKEFKELSELKEQVDRALANDILFVAKRDELKEVLREFRQWVRDLIFFLKWTSNLESLEENDMTLEELLHRHDYTKLGGDSKEMTHKEAAKYELEHPDEFDSKPPFELKYMGEVSRPRVHDEKPPEPTDAMIENMLLVPKAELRWLLTPAHNKEKGYYAKLLNLQKKYGEDKE